MSEPRRSFISCPSDCWGCATEDGETVAGPLSGASLVGHTLLTFLLPLTTAVAGAWWASTSATQQLLGAVLGLLVGMVSVRLFVILWRGHGSHRS